jgi:HSP20 family protein
MQLTRSQQYGSPLTRLRNELNRFWGYPDFEGTDFFEGWNPAVEMSEDKDMVTVKAEIPGMKKEDIDVSLHENQLILSGEKKCESERKDDGTRRSECFYGRFHRTIALPYAVDVAKIQASYRDGVLSVTLPKSEHAKPKRTDVKVA